MTLVRTFFSWGLVFAFFYVSFLAFTASIREENEILTESLIQKQTLLQRLQALPKRENKIKVALQELNDGLAERSLYSGDAAAVRTEVQRDVRRMAAEAQVQVGSIRPLGARRTDDELSLSAIQLNYSASHVENLKFLQLLERAEPILRVQRLSVSVQTASTETMAARLAVTVEVAGFVRSEREAE